jgi:acetyltransferase-like isoleucine patch superfamily enzyme
MKGIANEFHAKGMNVLMPTLPGHWLKNYKASDKVNFKEWLAEVDNNLAIAKKLGQKVLIGPYVVINAVTHLYQDTNQFILDQGCRHLEVFIGDGVWIGAHAVIMPGIKIGNGAVIGAGSIVTKDVESYSVVVGVPARKIKNRN